MCFLLGLFCPGFFFFGWLNHLYSLKWCLVILSNCRDAYWEVVNWSQQTPLTPDSPTALTQFHFSYPKSPLLGKSQKCCLLWSMVLILSQLSERTKVFGTEGRILDLPKAIPTFAANAHFIVYLQLKHFPLDAGCNFYEYERWCPFFISVFISYNNYRKNGSSGIFFFIFVPDW